MFLAAAGTSPPRPQHFPHPSEGSFAPERKQTFGVGSEEWICERVHAIVHGTGRGVANWGKK